LVAKGDKNLARHSQVTVIEFRQNMRTLRENTFDSEQKRQALDSVLQSHTFARADQLKRFLRYICEMEEAGRSDEITEYSIGTEALGRPRNYSPAVDSGVRGRAHDLRLKLEQFYELESPDTRIRVGLRKGSYTPYFFEVKPEHHETQSILIEAPPPVLAKPHNRMLAKAIVLNLVLVGAAVLGTRAFYMQRSQLDPIFEDFWGPMVRPGADVLLCLATPPSLLIKPYKEAPRSDIFRPLLPDSSAWYARLKLPETGGQPYMYFSGDSPLFGDAEAAVAAARVLSSAGASVDFLPENTLQPAALRNHNVVLIGSPNYSAYAARVMKNTPFTICEDSVLGEEVIRQNSSNPQTRKVFIPKRDETRSLVLVYGLITVFPNQTASDRNSRTVIVSGVTGAGAGAAMHFFASRSGLSTLRDRFRKDGLSKTPASYQIVVRGTRDRAVPLSWELAAYHVM
jgi:hypothetical protein